MEQSDHRSTTDELPTPIYNHTREDHRIPSSILHQHLPTGHRPTSRPPGGGARPLGLITRTLYSARILDLRVPEKLLSDTHTSWNNQPTDLLLIRGPRRSTTKHRKTTGYPPVSYTNTCLQGTDQHLCHRGGGPPERPNYQNQKMCHDT